MNSVKTASVLLVLAASLFAQAPVGEITGQVADSTGAVVTGAKVTVTNPATNQTRSVDSNESGVFSVPALQPGAYSIRLKNPDLVRRNAMALS